MTEQEAIERIAAALAVDQNVRLALADDDERASTADDWRSEAIAAWNEMKAIALKDMVHETTPQTQDVLIGGGDLGSVIPYSARHAKRLEAQGEFPKRVRLGNGRCGWWRSELIAWAKAKPRHETMVFDR